MYIEIESEDLTANQLTSKKTGEIYYTLEQEALFFSEDSKYPYHFKIRLVFDTDQSKQKTTGPIAKGRYTFLGSAYAVDRFGSLSLREISAKTLKPITAIPLSKTS
jgi:hypothetical protein